MDLLSNEVVVHRHGNRGRRCGLGLLRTAGGGLVAGCGARAYGLYGPLADLEAALVRLTLARISAAGMQLVRVPDVLPADVIERCGFPTDGERNQVCADLKIWSKRVWGVVF